MHRRFSRAALALVLIAAVSVPWFDYALDRAAQPVRIREHREVIDRTAQAPARYRVLVPFSMELMIRPIARVSGYDAAFRIVYAGFYGASLFGLLLMLQRYMELWFSAEHSLIGVLLVAATLPITLRYHTFAPWSILEAVMMTMGLKWIAQQKTWVILLLTLIATLNRETAVLIPLAALLDAAASRATPRRFMIPLIALAVWLVAFVVIRHWRGSAADLLTLNAIWTMNTSAQGLKTAVPAVALFLGVTGWLLAGYGVASAPPFVRTMLWLVVFYLPLYFVYGYWYEVRLLMPLYPVLVPSMVAGVARLGTRS